MHSCGEKTVNTGKRSLKKGVLPQKRGTHPFDQLRLLICYTARDYENNPVERVSVAICLRLNRKMTGKNYIAFNIDLISYSIRTSCDPVVLH